MAKIIEFCVPSQFRKKATRWIPVEQRGKLIPFHSAARLPEPVVPLPTESTQGISGGASAGIGLRREANDHLARKCRAVYRACPYYKRRLG